MGQRIDGWVIVSFGGRYLSRSGRWVEHRDKDRSRSKGLSRAWVHGPTTVLKQQCRSHEVAWVIPAHYDGDADATVADHERRFTLNEFLSLTSLQT